MSGLIFNSAPNENDNIIEVDPGTIIVTPSTAKGPSTAKEGSKRITGQLLVSFDTPLTQVSTTLLEELR